MALSTVILTPKPITIEDLADTEVREILSKLDQRQQKTIERGFSNIYARAAQAFPLYQVTDEFRERYGHLDYVAEEQESESIYGTALALYIDTINYCLGQAVEAFKDYDIGESLPQFKEGDKLKKFKDALSKEVKLRLGLSTLELAAGFASKTEIPPNSPRTSERIRQAEAKTRWFAEQFSEKLELKDNYANFLSVADYLISRINEDF